ncbi:hypothetical protein [Pseudomonas sp. 1928-m]|uniref:hypothetical protein n=1 Tax=Pseudomonas sp. 1928-m TaxID=3033804 RepID=UPI0023DF63F4|nr:hypothetical protein [Pseudomonas sp. 1928-m]MDF3194267.1 hypothetical protein [Pseudomonas sp. 1928-m]
MEWDSVASIAAICALAWSYGSAGEERRALFRSWVSGNIKKAKPSVSIALAKLGLLAVAIGAGLVAWGSGQEVYEFKVSLEPITRGEILRLLAVVFNTFSYSIASLVFVISVFKFPSQTKAIHARRPGEILKLKFDQSCQSDDLIEALKHDGVTLRVVSIKRGKVQVAVEGPAGVTISEGVIA